MLAFQFEYWNTSGQPVLFGDKTLAEWRTLGHDKSSLIADPLFVDPAKGHFRLQQGSPAAQIGFEPWDFSALGPRPAAAIMKAGASRMMGPLRRYTANPCPPFHF